MKRSAVILIPVLCALILGIIIFIRYRRRLDKAVSADSTPTDREHRLTSPAEAIPWILIIVLIVWNAISLSKISSMNLKLDSLGTNANSLMNQMWAMSSKIDALEKQLKAETDLLHEYDWSFGAFDGSTGRVRMNFTFFPNTYSEKSEFRLQFGAENVLCTRTAAGTYAAALDLDVFTPTDAAPVLTLSEDGVAKTQILDDVPRGEMWALVFPNYEAEGADLKAALKNGTLNVKGSFMVGNFGKSAAELKVTETVLVKEVDGKEAGRVPIDLPGSSFEPLKVEMDESFTDFKDSSRLTLFLEAKTDAGYSMKVQLFSLSAAENFAPQTAAGSLTIFDPAGKAVMDRMK